MVLRTKNIIDTSHESQRRTWRHFDPIRFRQKIKNVDWSQLYASNDINVINDIFEREVGDILETEAPMKFTQRRIFF